MRRPGRPTDRLARLRHGIAVAAVLALTTTARAQPDATVLLCPSCAGFERLDGGVFLERGASAEQRLRFAAAAKVGEERVTRFFGRLRATPTVVACHSTACWDRLAGGGAKGYAYGNFALLLSPLGLNPEIIAHERTHSEVHERLGLLRFLSGAVPAWFDEGLAVVVSDDLRYLRPAGAVDRCRVEPRTDLPKTGEEWSRSARIDHALYAEAACHVWRWMQAHGGRDAVLALIGQVAAGAAFDAGFAEAPKPITPAPAGG